MSFEGRSPLQGAIVPQSGDLSLSNPERVSETSDLPLSTPERVLSPVEVGRAQLLDSIAVTLTEAKAALANDPNSREIGSLVEAFAFLQQTISDNATDIDPKVAINNNAKYQRRFTELAAELEEVTHGLQLIKSKKESAATPDVVTSQEVIATEDSVASTANIETVPASAETNAHAEVADSIREAMTVLSKNLESGSNQEKVKVRKALAYMRRDLQKFEEIAGRLSNDSGTSPLRRRQLESLLQNHYDALQKNINTIVQPRTLVDRNFQSTIEGTPQATIVEQPDVQSQSVDALSHSEGEVDPVSEVRHGLRKLQAEASILPEGVTKDEVDTLMSIKSLIESLTSSVDTVSDSAELATRIPRIKATYASIVQMIAEYRLTHAPLPTEKVEPTVLPEPLPSTAEGQIPVRRILTRPLPEVLPVLDTFGIKAEVSVPVTEQVHELWKSVSTRVRESVRKGTRAAMLALFMLPAATPSGENSQVTGYERVTGEPSWSAAGETAVSKVTTEEFLAVNAKQVVPGVVFPSSMENAPGVFDPEAIFSSRADNNPKHTEVSPQAAVSVDEVTVDTSEVNTAIPAVTEQPVAMETVPTIHIVQLGDKVETILKNQFDILSKDLPKAVRDTLQAEMIAKFYTDKDLERSLGVPSGNIDDIFAGDTLDLTRFNAEAQALIDSYKPEPNAPEISPIASGTVLQAELENRIDASTIEVVAPTQVVSEVTEVPVTLSAVTKLSELSPEDRLHFLNWLGKEVITGAQKGIFGSLMSDTKENVRPWIGLTCGDVINISLLSPSEQRVECKALGITYEDFTRIDEILRQARLDGQLLAIDQSEALVTDALYSITKT